MYVNVYWWFGIASKHRWKYTHLKCLPLIKHMPRSIGQDPKGSLLELHRHAADHRRRIRSVECLWFTHLSVLVSSFVSSSFIIHHHSKNRMEQLFGICSFSAPLLGQNGDSSFTSSSLLKKFNVPNLGTSEVEKGYAGRPPSHHQLWYCLHCFPMCGYYHSSFHRSNSPPLPVIPNNALFPSLSRMEAWRATFGDLNWCTGDTTWRPVGTKDKALVKPQAGSND